DRGRRAGDVDVLGHDVARRTGTRDVLAAKGGGAHVDRDVLDPAITAVEPARDDAAWRLDGERVARDAPLVGQPAREDAHAVAALLRLAAVGIPDAQPSVGARRAGERQHAV